MSLKAKLVLRLYEAYSEALLPDLSDKQVKELVAALTATGIRAASDRLHARWARHLLNTLDESSRELLAALPSSQDAEPFGYAERAAMGKSLMEDAERVPESGEGKALCVCGHERFLHGTRSMACIASVVDEGAGAAFSRVCPCNEFRLAFPSPVATTGELHVEYVQTERGGEKRIVTGRAVASRDDLAGPATTGEVQDEDVDLFASMARGQAGYHASIASSYKAGTVGRREHEAMASQWRRLASRLSRSAAPTTDADTWQQKLHEQIAEGDREAQEIRTLLGLPSDGKSLIEQVRDFTSRSAAGGETSEEDPVKAALTSLTHSGVWLSCGGGPRGYEVISAALRAARLTSRSAPATEGSEERRAWVRSVVAVWRDYWQPKTDHRYGQDFAAFLGERFLTDSNLRDETRGCFAASPRSSSPATTASDALLREAAVLIDDLTDDEECRRDHHGNCQTHRLEASCSNARGRAWLARWEAAATPDTPTSEER